MVFWVQNINQKIKSRKTTLQTLHQNPTFVIRSMIVCDIHDYMTSYSMKNHHFYLKYMTTLT
jgi:hypothetical protein